ncbi:MAG: hypothetical protein JRF72_05345, partial [Deltaproteobacteria bacterium]|nr:hypothetical protein [Deltaproteobacteria bacterium]
MKRDNNEFKSSSIVNFISVVSGIVTLISTGPTAFLIIINPHSYISKLMLIFFGITFSFWFLLTLIKAKSSFVSESKTPFPKSFWKFLFNALPVSTGSKYDSKTKILIIYDDSTEEVFHRIKAKYNDISLAIDCLNISGKSGLKHAIQEKLSKCDSLLFFYTEEMQRNKEIYDLINNWGLKNSHKAILAVTDCPFRITFNTIPMKEADSSLWRLLSRCTERSYQWLLQARLFRRVGIILSSMLAVVIGLAFNNYSNAEKRMEVLFPKYIEANISELHKKAEATDFTGMINGIGHYTPILRKEINEILKNKKREVY